MKAATIRRFIYFLDEVCMEDVNLFVPAGAMRAAMLRNFVLADKVMRRAGRILTVDESRELVEYITNALTSYNALSVVFDTEKLFHCIPKMHMCLHMARSRINPRWVQCYADEDMVGRMKLIYSGTHGLTGPLRSIQRYCIIVGIRWQHELNRLRGVAGG